MLHVQKFSNAGVIPVAFKLQVVNRHSPIYAIHKSPSTPAPVAPVLARQTPKVQGQPRRPSNAQLSHQSVPAVLDALC